MHSWCISSTFFTVKKPMMSSMLISIVPLVNKKYLKLGKRSSKGHSINKISTGVQALIYGWEPWVYPIQPEAGMYQMTD